MKLENEFAHFKILGFIKGYLSKEKWVNSIIN
jgi:hypothetical protein